MIPSSRTFASLILCGGLIWAVAIVGVQAAPVPKAATKGGATYELKISPDCQMKFVWIPPGSTDLGSPPEELDAYLTQLKLDKTTQWLQLESRKKRGSTKTEGFWLGRFEVTQHQWLSVCGKENAPFDYSSSNPDHPELARVDTTQYPVDHACYRDCEKFLTKLNEISAVSKHGVARLPNENEWEYACRGGMKSDTPYYYGNSMDGTQCNCNGHRAFPNWQIKGVSLDGPVEVGKYQGVIPTHPWGLVDIYGNVAEYCNSRFNNSEKVVRGGSWLDPAIACRSASRAAGPINLRLRGMGFRLVFDFQK